MSFCSRFAVTSPFDVGLRRMHEIIPQFIKGLKDTTLLEYLAVFSGIISVVFSRIENVWVYPTGLVNTIIYIYLSLKGSLLGEASVNFYYTVMSVYGWWLWTRKDRAEKPLVKVSFSNKREWVQQLLFFLFFYMAIFFALTYLKKQFSGAIPWADAFASATAYTGMWLMAKKKVESWWWWIATNIASIPLYFVKGYVFTSVYYVVLFVLAVFGLMEWQRRGKATGNAATFALENS
jgi:nicotinamide mononucleotide transporter